MDPISLTVNVLFVFWCIDCSDLYCNAGERRNHNQTPHNSYSNLDCSDQHETEWLELLDKWKQRDYSALVFCFSPLLLHENYENVELYQTEQIERHVVLYFFSQHLFFFPGWLATPSSRRGANTRDKWSGWEKLTELEKIQQMWRTTGIKMGDGGGT